MSVQMPFTRQSDYQVRRDILQQEGGERAARGVPARKRGLARGHGGQLKTCEAPASWPGHRTGSVWHTGFALVVLNKECHRPERETDVIFRTQRNDIHLDCS